MANTKARPHKGEFTEEQRRRAGKEYAEAAWASAAKGPSGGAVKRLAERFGVADSTICKVGQAFIIATMAQRIEELLSMVDWAEWQRIFAARGVRWGYPPNEHVPTIDELREQADLLLHLLVNPRQGPVVTCGGLLARRDFDGSLELEIEK